MPRLLLITHLGVFMVCQGCQGPQTSAQQTASDPGRPEFWDGPPKTSGSLMDWFEDHPTVKNTLLTLLVGGAVVLVVGPALLFRPN
jgi:hypothetical protein